LNWDENLVLARALAQQPFEVTQRAAVSLAYYGAFNLARRWLEANVGPVDNGRAHQQVWQTFAAAAGVTEGDDRWRLLGRLGDSLRRFRNQVDYDDEVEDLLARATGALHSAERMIGIVAEL
jgi:hypothetical protein